MPRRPQPVYDRICACGCGKQFQSTRHYKRFATLECQVRHNNRKSARGAKLIDAAIRWRKKRDKGSFTDMCAILDDIIAEDRKYEKARKA